MLFRSPPGMWYGSMEWDHCDMECGQSSMNAWSVPVWEWEYGMGNFQYGYLESGMGVWSKAVLDSVEWFGD